MDKNSTTNNGIASWRPTDRMRVGRKRQSGDLLGYFRATFELLSVSFICKRLYLEF